MTKQNFVRASVLALSLSATGFISYAIQEGWTDKAIIPTKGDVPTIGFGSTVHIDGSRVKMGDKTDPVTALQTMRAHISKDEAAFRASCPDCKLSQEEYDLYLDFIYQYGIANWRTSSMLRNLKDGNYQSACDSLLMWKRAAGRDCSIRANGCYGVWTRQLDRHRKCLAAVEKYGAGS